MQKRSDREALIPTASMADIGFLLLTFFLVTTSINVDKGLRLVLPPKVTDEKPVPSQNLFSIFVTEAGEVANETGEMFATIPVKKLSGTLKPLIRQNDKLIVSIKTDRNTAYAHYIAVMDVVQQAYGGRPRISIAEP